MADKLRVSSESRDSNGLNLAAIQRICLCLEKIYSFKDVSRDSLNFKKRCPSVTLLFFDADYNGSISRFVGKVFYAYSEPDVLKGIVDAMNHAYICGINCPRPINTEEGELVCRVGKDELPESFSYPEIWSVEEKPKSSEKEKAYLLSKKRRIADTSNCFYIYVMTYIPGDQFSRIDCHTHSHRWMYGFTAGKLSAQLMTFTSVAIRQRVYDYDWKCFHNLKSHIRSPRVHDKSLEKYLTRTFRDFETHVSPRLATLQSGICHNDCTPSNFIFNSRTHIPEGKDSLSDNRELSCESLLRDQYPGVIDFDDICFGPYVFELAIAVTHEMVVSHAKGQCDFLSAVSPVMEGFLSAFPLPNDELDLLRFIIPARLVQVYVGLSINVREDCNCSRPDVCPYVKCIGEVKGFMKAFFATDQQDIRRHLQYKI